MNFEGDFYNYMKELQTLAYFFCPVITYFLAQ